MWAPVAVQQTSLAPISTCGIPELGPAGPTGQLATWLARATLAGIPAEVRSRARYLLLDGVGCLLVGAVALVPYGSGSSHGTSLRRHR